MSNRIGGIMSSYQRLKRRIAYYKQCENELKGIALTLAAELGKVGKTPPLAPPAIRGDQFLTPYNTADFQMDLLLTAQRAADQLGKGTGK